MGRAQRRKFLKSNPYCAFCWKCGRGKVRTTKAIGLTPLCDGCYDTLMASYRAVGMTDDQVQKAVANGGVYVDYQPEEIKKDEV